MEFYPILAHSVFEYPLVSIPNGMEFYPIAYKNGYAVCLFQFPTGWNSTRPNTAKSPRKDVSIPNGMEFYIWAKSCIVVAGARFNSQRDGILRIFNFMDGAMNLFQFPTGWNSTGIFGFYDCRANRFQFPTGWNSTEQG